MACDSGCLKLGFFSSMSSTTNVTSCMACGSNALSCSSATIASSCKSGFFLDGSA